ncbi:M48 family metallopeptidase [Deinococcus petrolearius]|uniref:M48 family metallopeptidase n=1 Tax=Deinococcus petrolearius TaxID=1751295 RepID=A0ABW1DHC6_9DEIO
MPAPPAPRPAPLTLGGLYFDGRSSRAWPATLEIGPGQPGAQAVLTVGGAEADAGGPRRWPVSALRAEPALPGIRRVVRLPGGGRFETGDDAGVRALEARTCQNRVLGRVRRLEGGWGPTLGTTAALGLFVWAFLTSGLPALARVTAAATPLAVLETFDRESVRLLDSDDFLAPSRLSAARQAELGRGFARVGAWAGGGYRYRLLLRDGDPPGAPFALGANAFALPGGTVVMTDQLVALAGSDRELMGVLAHETGHVTGRHALASVYQGLGLALLGTAVTGDLVGAGTFAAAAPSALLRGGYSRRAETGADEHAGAYLLRAYGTTRPLRDLLARLETGDLDRRDGPAPGDLLRTHPGTAQRIEHLRGIERTAR